MERARVTEKWWGGNFFLKWAQLGWNGATTFGRDGRPCQEIDTELSYPKFKLTFSTF